MAFSESLKRKIKRKAHMSCCLCRSLYVEVHHIIPQEESGPDTEDNAAPLCPSCHEIFGANPDKRKFIREARDFWYEICRERFAGDSDRLDELKHLVKNTVSHDDLQDFREELFSDLVKYDAHVKKLSPVTFIPKPWNYLYLSRFSS